MAICFLLKHAAKFFRNLFNRGMFVLKILISFAPVVGLQRSSQVQLIAGVKEQVKRKISCKALICSKLSRTQLMT
mgnify:FL=1